jgi:hypothetical protein
MKKFMTFIACITFLSTALSTGAAAQCANRMAGGHEAGAEAGPAKCGMAAVSPEIMQKFNKETRALQEQLIDKQSALKKEWLKDDPDPDAIAAMLKAIVDINKDMAKAAKKLGMKPSCHMFKMDCCGGGGCGGGMGGCGGGMGGMRGCGMK